MSNKLAVTVDSVHRVGTAAYLTVDGVHRKVKKMYRTTDGVHRLCYQSAIEWNKYSLKTSHGTYTAFTPAGTSSSGLINAYVYPSYTFSSATGYDGSGSGAFLTSLGASGVGYYMVGDYDYEESGISQSQVHEITAYDEDTGRFTHKIIKAANATLYYEKGGTSYGTVEAEEGAVPDGGTLITGSVTGSCCVVKVGSTYYYYEKA